MSTGIRAQQPDSTPLRLDHLQATVRPEAIV